MLKVLMLALLLAGCNTTRPEILNRGDDEVVALPNGAGLLILQRAREEQPSLCWARAKNFHGLVQMPCDLAESARP